MITMNGCNICPRNCEIDRENNKTGICGMTKDIKIARAALHFWEEPCISGKEGSGTVFFSGCNLRCVYCQNYKISKEYQGEIISIEQLKDIFIKLQEEGANNINLVTPTHFTPQIKKGLLLAKKEGLNIPVVYNSGGYELIEALKELDGLIDIYLPDFKYIDNKYAIKYSSCKDYVEVAKDAIDEMVRQTGKCQFNDNGIMTRGVIVRHLMLPGLKDESKKIIEYLFNKYNDKIFISIMNQYTPLEWVGKFPELNRTVSKKEYDDVIDYAINIGVENAFIQEGGAVGESFIPEFFGE